MKSLLCTLLLAVPLLAPGQTIPVSLRLQATEANSPPGTCGCFWLKGGAADAALPIFYRFSAVVDFSGATVSQVPGTSKGLSILTLLAGPRYTAPLPFAELHLQALAGAVHGFDADFVTGAQRTDTATAFAYALGGALDVPLSPQIAVRAVQVEYLQTDLPNGVDNRQRNLRLEAGVVFRVHLPQPRGR